MHQSSLVRGFSRCLGALFLAVMVLGAISLVRGPDSALATHFRGTELTWTKVSGTTVAFQITSSFRADYPYAACGSNGFTGNNTDKPPVGATVAPGLALYYGDGQVASSVCMKVVSVDTAEDVATLEADTTDFPTVFTHTYSSGTAPWTAYLEGCCSLSTLLDNNHDINYRIQTVVDPAVASGSPTSSLPPIISCPKNPPCDFTVPATDPDGLPLSYSFTTSAESDLTETSPPGTTINASTGLFSWPNYGTTADGLYSTEVMIEAKSGSTVVASTAVSFILDRTVTTNNPPAFQPPTPADGTVITVAPGNTASFTVQASDPDTGDTVTLAVVNAPPGTFTQTTTGQTSTGTFSWTPTAPGSLVLNLTAEDQLGLGATTQSVTIFVTQPATPVITWSTPADITYGTALSATQLDAVVTDPTTHNPVTGTTTYTPAIGAVLNTGANQNLHVDFTPADTAAYTAASADVKINVLQAKPVLTWTAPASITYPTPLSATQLDATASPPGGTFVYTPALGTVLDAGANQSLGVVYTPADSTNYATASANVSITVLPQPTSVTVSPATVDFSDSVSLKANAGGISAGTVSTGGSIQFTINGAAAGAPQPIDASGNASATVTPSQQPGSYALGATFTPSNSDFASSTASTPNGLTVSTEDTKIAYSGPTAFGNGLPTTLKATLTDKDDGTPIAGKTLSFTLGSQTCTTVPATDANGNTQCTLTVTGQPAGTVTVKVDFAGDSDYQSAHASTSAYAGSFAGSGGNGGANSGASFVLGDNTVSAATPSTTVTFWGSGWSGQNSLTSGAAPSSFDGYADSPSANPPACGGTFTTSPGNSAHPPSSLSGYILAFVSSNVTKSGSTISGDIKHIVLVQVAPGYAGDPGHAGTGKILGTVC